MTTDDIMNDEIQKEIAAIEAAKKEREQKSEQTSVRELKNNYDFPKKVITTSRIGVKQYFFVFQNKSFDVERCSGTCGPKNQIKMGVKFHIG